MYNKELNVSFTLIKMVSIIGWWVGMGSRIFIWGSDLLYWYNMKRNPKHTHIHAYEKDKDFNFLILK